ncbi:MAG: cyclic nucleotide-binding domain-containing protein [Desulfamplus sp.]|nr:cyclic nucleotide-binding domain-containing protein [Desulfamplus sp.]
MGYFLEELFSSVPLFTNLSKSSKQYLYGLTGYDLPWFDQDQLIIEEGSASTSFFILVKGAAKVVRKESPDETIAILQPGDIFGEMSYLTGKRRSANVVACEPQVLVMCISKQLMQNMPPEIRDVINGKLIELMVLRVNRIKEGILDPEH